MPLGRLPRALDPRRPGWPFGRARAAGHEGGGCLGRRPPRTDPYREPAVPRTSAKVGEARGRSPRRLFSGKFDEGREAEALKLFTQRVDNTVTNGSAAESSWTRPPVRPPPPPASRRGLIPAEAQPPADSALLRCRPAELGCTASPFTTFLADTAPAAAHAGRRPRRADGFRPARGGAAAAGLCFYDMPLTGGSAGARTGTPVLLGGGDPCHLPALRPVLDAFARDVRHFGPAGAGTRFKLILNALQAVHPAGFGEALRLAEPAGLDPRQVGEALLDRPGGVVTRLAWDSYLSPPVPLNCSAEWAHEDLTYAARVADESGQGRTPSSTVSWTSSPRPSPRAAARRTGGLEDWRTGGLEDGQPGRAVVTGPARTAAPAGSPSTARTAGADRRKRAGRVRGRGVVGPGRGACSECGADVAFGPPG
ncbi:NAD(P)-binding domain-containing protein [Streptomyces cinerochromogenes]|uniref:NAD(P)-binding domain-containing protein n=1 Tax=Streptomyces cinerochromogenes TaxID=66422 RepID=UPI00367FA032